MVSVNRHPHSDVRLQGRFEKSDTGKSAHALNKQLMQFKSSLLATWAESFVIAGSSALLLLIANLHPHYWYFSFFALTPFLYRIIKATPAESLRLGFLLGISYFGVSSINLIPVSPSSCVYKLLLGTGLFASFGWAVGWARKHWGFYPSIVAVLWIGLELGLMKFGFTGGLLVPTEYSNPFLRGLVGLFGFLIVSAIIVLLNSILILAIVKTLEAIKPKGNTFKKVKRRWLLSFSPNLSAKKVYVVPEGRAPPIISETASLKI
jgi:apolipoprotein N-acyltransferase